ncbi:MAG: SH3 domain-containing protein [Oscillatoriales cyanobacterium]|nr:MAG: SH3 domain-containing protein [Oscillatoriales cyanobacterium]
MKHQPSAILAIVAQTIATLSTTIAVPALASEPLPPIEAYVCTSGAPLNLRQAPGPNAAVIAQIPNQSPIWQVAPVAGNWVPVATSEARGYVWANYVCDRVSTEIDVDVEADAGSNEPPIATKPQTTTNATPARCSREENIRNVRRAGGIDVHDLPNAESQVVATLNDGAAITIVPTAVNHDDGSIWLPISYPSQGYLMAGRNGVVNNVVYCTRFYD